MAHRPSPSIVSFDPGNDGGTAEVAATLRTMAAEGRGWVNLEPEVPEELDAAAASARGGVFSNRGPSVPLCTWTAPGTDRKGRTGPQTIGVQHGTSERARVRLGHVGLEVPAAWMVRSDNPKRGLVIEVPTSEDPGAVLAWLLAAGEALATVPLTGNWFATVHRR